MTDGERGTGCSIDSINREYAKRLRSLLSVDDLVVELEATLREAGEWDSTFVVYLSDHGYSQGQFRLCSHKSKITINQEIYDRTFFSEIDCL